MINKNALMDDLIDGFMRYQYHLENPMSFPEMDELISKYRNDAVFHSKVESLACGVMRIVEKHINEG